MSDAKKPPDEKFDGFAQALDPVFQIINLIMAPGEGDHTYRLTHRILQGEGVDRQIDTSTGVDLEPLIETLYWRYANPQQRERLRRMYPRVFNWS